ncbi:hypothetical protein [Robertmurraya korlensis]|uniref:hypothetical protein n=1 Tax=Robertmurraya korlensis TaxID=519977 RepID=UPI000AA4EE9F|nr:hypothetical protein [Robertmurraya korlensis]
MKIRREHIKAHLALYNKLLIQLETFDKPYQSWICIHEEDPISDAVYIHSPNPNDNHFPLKINELKWDCVIPNTFKDIINLNKFNVAFYKSEYEELYYIQSKEHGIKL